ncbi:hypothetical protein TrRE_jg11372, partial [Triparma retinervis]
MITITQLIAILPITFAFLPPPSTTTFIKTHSTAQFTPPLSESQASAASLLCILDCTILPLLSLLLPFLTFLPITATLSPSFLHTLSYKASIYFVLPIGSLSACLNLLTSNKSSTPLSKYLPFSIALTGLLLIFATNSSLSSLPLLGPLIPPSLSHSLSCTGDAKGVQDTLSAHTIANLAGAGMLIGGNRAGHKNTHKEGDCCA